MAPKENLLEARNIVPIYHSTILPHNVQHYGHGVRFDYHAHNHNFCSGPLQKTSIVSSLGQTDSHYSFYHTSILPYSYAVLQSVLLETVP